MGAEVLAGVAFVGMLLACYRLGAERSAREAQGMQLGRLEQVLSRAPALHPDVLRLMLGVAIANGYSAEQLARLEVFG